LKKKEKEIEGDGYEEEEAEKEESQTQQRGRVPKKLFIFFYSSPIPNFVSVVISILYFISFYKAMKYTETIQ
jgi:hypothetical protein